MVAIFAGCYAPNSERLTYGRMAESLTGIDGSELVELRHRDSATSPAPLTPEPIRWQHVRSLESLPIDRFQHMCLRDVLRIALENNAVVRDRHAFLSPSNLLLNNPEQSPSVFDVPIQATGRSGAEAALAAFDLQATVGAQWGQNSLVQENSFATGNLPTADILVRESGTLYGRLDKPLASGALVSLIHDWTYAPRGLATGGFGTNYVGYLRSELRQPLWAGRGRELTHIAGPAVLNAGNLGWGVTVARLDQNMTVAQFEARLALLLKQTEELYWELWYAHQSYTSLVAARDSARQILQQVQARSQAGLDGGDTVDLAQAEESFYDRQNLVDNALVEVLQAQSRLRRLAGLPLSDDHVILPADQPFQGGFHPHWEGALATALANRVELRQQRFRIEILELQRRAARNLAHPRLDLVAGAQLNGFGDELFSSGLGSNAGAVGSLFDADESGWNVGFEFSMPLGIRAARAQSRNMEHRLAKARAVLAAQESEISYEVAHVFHQLDRTLLSTQTAQRRSEAARTRLQAVDADYQAGRSSLDLLLRSQVALAEAEQSYFRSLAGYNQAITDFLYRAGSLLAQNCVAIDKQGNDLVATRYPRMPALVR